MGTACRLVFVASLLAGVPATAAPVTFEFQGIVTQVVFPENLDGSVGVGTPLSGSYSYDPSTPNVSPDPENVAAYEGISFGVVVGNYEFRSLAAAPDIIIFLIDGPLTDVLGVNSLENEAIGFFPPPPGRNYDSLISMQWRLSGGNSLTGTELPSQPPDLSQWLGSVLTVAADKGLVGDGVFTIYGQVTSVVPEPGAAELLSPTLLIVFFAAALLRRRRAAASRAWPALLSTVAAVCLGSAMPHSAVAQVGGGGDVPVTNAALDVLGVGVTQQETTIAVRQVGPTTTVCVGFRDFGNNARINGFGYSLNGGTSFIDGGSLPVGPFADPSLMVDSAGDFLYGSLRGGLQQLDLHTSTNCQGFSYAELIANVPGASGQFTVDKPFLTHDSYPGSPNFGRTWAAYDRLVSPVGVWVAYSDDAGDDAPEWVAQEQVPGAGSHPWPAVAPNGDLYVAGIGGTAVGIAHRSTLGVWTAKAPVTTTAAFSGDATATFDCGRRSLKGRMRSEPLPQIAIHPDASAPAGFVIHAVWQADPDGSGAGTDVSDVYYSRSIDGATTWSAPMRVNDDPVGSARDQWNPALAVSPSAPSPFERLTSTA